MFYDFNWSTNRWNLRQVWYNFDTKEYEICLNSVIPQDYTVKYCGLPGKVISMAGYMNFDGYIDLSELTFK